MDPDRLDKFQPREKDTSKKNGLGSDQQDETEENLSKATKQKAAAAKQYIENHYRKQMKNLQERKERYSFHKMFLFTSSFLLLFEYHGIGWRIFVLFLMANFWET